MQGIDIILYDKQKTGEDAFGHPVYAETPVTVENVLVGEPTSDEVTDALNLYGKHVAYTLAIPKGDTNTWTDRMVEFFGEKFKVIGHPTQGIDHLIPLAWNKKVRVEHYE
jgi:hypothetical protein